MIFAGVTYIQPRGKEIYKLLHKAMSLDWTDETHTLTISYVPTGNGVTEHTELSILVQLAEETSVEVKVSLAHLHQKYIRYVPIGWEITVINVGQLIDDFHATWGITAATLRQLIIQREIANNIAKVILRGIEMNLPVPFEMLGQVNFKDYKAFLERTAQFVEPILKLDRLYPDPIMFHLTW